MIEDYKKIFKDPPVLETQRLIFRPMRLTDAEDMYEFACREEVTGYLLWTPHESVEYTRKYLAFLKNQYKQGLFYDWAVVLKENRKMIGTGGFTSVDERNGWAEIGYVLSNDYWGKGYGQEIARELLSFGFNLLDVHRIQARYICGNERSLRVMERIGMVYEGTARGLMLVKGEYKDIGCCSILQEEYFERYGKESDRYDHKTGAHWYDRLW